MKSKTEKRKVKDYQELFSWRDSCFSVNLEPLKELQKGQLNLELFWKNTERKSYQDRNNYSEIFGFDVFSVLRKYGSYGAWATADDSPNRSRSLDVTPFAVMPWSILTGSRVLNIAVRMIVMAIERI